MEQLNTPSFPVAIPRIAVIAGLSRENTDPSNLRLHLQIYSGNQQLFAGPLGVNFMQQLTARTVAEMHGLVVPRPGVLNFVLLNGEERLDSWTINVNQVGQIPLQIFMPPAQQQGGQTQ